jgi:DEAD/DEAH box helicase domain-containing protein
VHVTSQVVGFKKIKFHTNENVGAGELTMPENEMHTTAYWLTVPREVMRALPFSLEERRDGVVALSYTLGQLAALFLMCDRHDLGVALGDNGQGDARIERGRWPRSSTADAKDRPQVASGAGLRSAFVEAEGTSFHLAGRSGSTPAERAGGLGGAAQHLPEEDADYEPNLFVYDAYPGGIGLSEPLYRLHDRLLAESRALIAACACQDGCPSCVGPAGEVGSRGKEVALAILDAVRRNGPAGG